ncbi:hypothetical protein COCOBI_05-0410 [Coccomyxa sp. Obi]|nr:hypothetical protein COCOBI_05-0410 [Coccomyxa sp. Obi]
MHSQPIPLDVFGDVDLEHAHKVEEAGTALSNGWIAPKQMNPATHANTAGADATTYKKGDLAWYRQRDGTFVPAKVVSVDLTVHPPSYAVDLGGNVRETEAPRLRPRGPGDSSPPPTVPPGGNTFVLPAPLPPSQKAIASCGPPTAVSVFASSGTLPVPVSVPVSASSAGSWPSAEAGSADNSWCATGAKAAAEEDEDFGEFCDADVSAASAGSSGAALPFPNGATLPKLQPDQQSAWSITQPPLAGMQHGRGATGASFGGFLHLLAPAALPRPQAAAAAPAINSTGTSLSFASFDAFRLSASTHSSAGAAEPSRVAWAAAGSGMNLLPGAAASSLCYPPLWPAAVQDQASLHSPQHPLGPPAVANGGAEEFGDFEAADWQAHPASSAACAASGPADPHLLGKLEEAAKKSEAGTGGGRGVTPASTIDIAREELDLSEASDEDDFGDFEDAASGDGPAEAPAAASAPKLGRSAPLPMSLFGEETDPAEASPPLPSLALAAPWGGFSFNQGQSDQAPPAAHIVTPTPVLAPPSQAPDQATVSPLGTAAATQLPTGGGAAVLFPACAPATPLPSEHTPCAADVTPLSAPGLSAQRQGTPGAAAPHEAVADARSGVSETADNSTGSDVLSEWAAPPQPAMLDVEASLHARKDTGTDTFADAQPTTQNSLGEPGSASSGESAAVSATAVAEGTDRGSGQGINWDALDFSFADDMPEEAPQAPEASPDVPASSAQRGVDAPAESTETAQLAGPMEDTAAEHSMPSGAIGQEETTKQTAAMTGAASVESPQAQYAQPAEQQEPAEDAEAEEWGDFEEFPAPENSADVTTEATEGSHWDQAWSGEPIKSGNAAVEGAAESATGSDHGHELAHFPVLAAAGASSGIPSSSAAPNQDNAAMMWPAESAVEERETVSTAELALLPDLAATQPSAGVPSHPATTDWDLFESGLGGGLPTAGAEITSPSQPKEAEAAGWGWDVDDSWLAADAEMRPALPSADVWNTLASCDSSYPAPEVQSRVGSVPQGDDMFDEGLWDGDWAAGSSELGSPDMLLVQPPAAAVSRSFAGHDRATALRLLAKAAETELAEGLRIWSEACSGGCQASFCAGAAEQQYIMALVAVYFVACALRGGCAIGGVDDAAIAGSLTRCQECWHGQTPGMPALRTAYEAATAEAEPSQLSIALTEACGLLEAPAGLEEEGTHRTGPCCAITCLPLALCPAVPAVHIEGGSCWAPVANLWANRVQPALETAHKF